MQWKNCSYPRNIKCSRRLCNYVLGNAHSFGERLYVQLLHALTLGLLLLPYLVPQMQLAQISNGRYLFPQILVCSAHTPKDSATPMHVIKVC